MHDVYYLCFLVLSFFTSPLSQSLTGTGIMLVFDDDDDDDDIDDGDDDDDLTAALPAFARLTVWVGDQTPLLQFWQPAFSIYHQGSQN